jgi:hypothetical protein
MFVVLMPVSADILGRFLLQPLALAFFGINTALLCLASSGMRQYASHSGRLLEPDFDPYIVKMIASLWLYPPIVIALTISLGYLSVYPVYAIWVLLPVISYSYSMRVLRRYRPVPG